MVEPRTVRVFVASPDDVVHERRRLEGVVQRLNGKSCPVRSERQQAGTGLIVPGLFVVYTK